MATNPFTIPIANADNTIAVGNLTDLAGILTNLTPEQLQNIQLDPALFEALSKTIEPTVIFLFIFIYLVVVETVHVELHIPIETKICLLDKL